MNEPKCVAQRGRYTDSGKRSVKGNGPIEQYYEARVDGKTNTLTTVQKDNNVAVPIRIGALPRPDGTLSTSQAFRIYDVGGKSVNITAGGGGAGGKTGLYAEPITPFVEKKFDKAVEKYGYIPEMYNPYKNVEIADKSPTQTTGCGSQTTSATVMITEKSDKPVYEVKDGMITIKGKQYPIKLADGHYIIRKLTVSECKRLQTVPEWYEFPVSDSQAYKMLGNGWTVDVIQHLIKHTLSGKVVKPKTEEYKQLEWSDYEER